MSNSGSLESGDKSTPDSLTDMKRSAQCTPRNMSNTYLINRPADFRFTQFHLITLELFETIYLKKLTKIQEKVSRKYSTYQFY